MYRYTSVLIDTDRSDIKVNVGEKVSFILTRGAGWKDITYRLETSILFFPPSDCALYCIYIQYSQYIRLQIPSTIIRVQQ
jgi:hypothetical protein